MSINKVARAVDMLLHTEMFGVWKMPNLLLSARYYDNKLNLKGEVSIMIKERECSEVSSKRP